VSRCQHFALQCQIRKQHIRQSHPVNASSSKACKMQRDDYAYPALSHLLWHLLVKSDRRMSA